MRTEEKDLRDEILFKVGKELAAKKNKDWVAEITLENYIKGLQNLDNHDKDLYQLTITAMDEYFKRRSMELLEWMVNNNVELPDLSDVIDENGNNFRYKGEWITKEQLFNNFQS